MSRSRSSAATRRCGRASGSSPSGCCCVLGLSYYARARIGVQRWRRLHRFAALAWLLGLVHALGEGTDAGQRVVPGDDRDRGGRARAGAAGLAPRRFAAPYRTRPMRRRTTSAARVSAPAATPPAADRRRALARAPPRGAAPRARGASGASVAALAVALFARRVRDRVRAARLRARSRAAPAPRGDALRSLASKVDSAGESSSSPATAPRAHPAREAGSSAAESGRLHRASSEHLRHGIGTSAQNRAPSSSTGRKHRAWRLRGEDVAVVSRQVEAIEEFECFGVALRGARRRRRARAGSAAGRGRLAQGATLLSWHARFSRFLPDSELSRLNRDPRQTVPVRPLMARLARAVRDAPARASGGLVDGTLVGRDRARRLPPRARAGRRARCDARPGAAPPRGRAGAGCPLARARGGPRRRGRSPARRALEARQRRPRQGPVRGRARARRWRPTRASRSTAPAISLLGGAGAGTLRPVEVASPFDGRHDPHVRARARRRGDERHRPAQLARRGAGAPAHHLLDPATGRPAFTGVVQVTALAPTRARRGDQSEGGAAERSSARPPLAAARRRDRVRRRRHRVVASRRASVTASPSSGGARRPLTAGVRTPNSRDAELLGQLLGGHRPREEVTLPGLTAEGGRCSMTASVSMPSATTFRPRLRARSSVERTIASARAGPRGCR